MATRKRKNKPGAGRPTGTGKGLTARLEIKVPPELVALAVSRAADASVTPSEWWRRAAAHYASCVHAGLLADED